METERKRNDSCQGSPLKCFSAQEKLYQWILSTVLGKNRACGHYMQRTRSSSVPRSPLEQLLPVGQWFYWGGCLQQGSPSVAICAGPQGSNNCCHVAVMVERRGLVKVLCSCLLWCALFAGPALRSSSASSSLPSRSCGPPLVPADR